MAIFLCLLAYCGFLSLVLYAQRRGGKLGDMFDIEPRLDRRAIRVEAERDRS